MSNDNDRVTIGEWVVEGKGTSTAASWTGYSPEILVDGDGDIMCNGYYPPAVMVEVLRRMGALDRPGLPAEPAAGMVRCRAAVVVDGGGLWHCEGDCDQEGDEAMARDMALRSGWRLSFVTFDAPKPEPAAEIVGVVVTA